MRKPDSVARRLLRWFDRHGRKDLPWQHPRTPYRVWLSEVMLQQTQVASVIPYFLRFVEKFPSLPALAAAAQDDVLALWSGLGYYSRARNLHRAARVCVVDHHGGDLPVNFDALIALPGIGRSTAGAILAQAHCQRLAILDGNVKRVLTRMHGLRGWPGSAAVETQLWKFAELHMPRERIADYTQAIMDMGATLCTRSRPQCSACPLAADCVAHRDGLTAQLPERKARRALPTRSTVMLLLRDRTGRLLLQRRPWKCDCVPAIAAVRPHVQSLPARRDTARIGYRRADARGRRCRSPLAASGGSCSTRPARAGSQIDRIIEGIVMARTVFCIKLQREAEGLTCAPYPGELGKRIYANVSKDAWSAWLAHQTMLINENRLSPLDPKARKFLEAEMEKYFFGDGSTAPAGFVPPEG